VNVIIGIVVDIVIIIHSYRVVAYQSRGRVMTEAPTYFTTGFAAVKEACNAMMP